MTSTTTAAPAMAHGSADVVPLFLGLVSVGEPHAWQKRAPGVMAEPQDEQAAAPSVAPQPLQNLPVAVCPQLGHLVVDWLMS